MGDFTPQTPTSGATALSYTTEFATGSGMISDSYVQAKKGFLLLDTEEGSAFNSSGIRFGADASYGRISFSSVGNMGIYAKTGIYLRPNSSTAASSVGVVIDTSGDVTINGNLLVKGGITMYATDAESGLANDFLPSVTGTYNVGSTTLRWKGFYGVTGNLSGGLTFTTTANTSANNSNGIVFGTLGRIGINTSGDIGVCATRNIYLRTQSTTSAIGTTGLTINQNGSATLTGTLTQGSDMTMKSVHEDKVLSLEMMSDAPLFEYHFLNDENESVHVGTSAQYWQCLDGIVVKGEDDRLAMDYSSLGVAMGISLAREVLVLKERIKELENEIEQLKN